MSTLGLETGSLEFVKTIQPDKDEYYSSMERSDSWYVHNSDLTAYCAEANFPEQLNPKRVIEAQLDAGTDNVGLDIAGGRDGVALGTLLRAGRLSQAIVTNYLDRRSPSTRRNSRLEHIEGDIREPKTWEQIIAKSEEAAPNGLALILHRPLGALQNVPSEAAEQATHLLLDLLRPGGVLYCQIPSSIWNFSDKGVLAGICGNVRSRSDTAFATHSIPSPGFAYAMTVKGDAKDLAFKIP
jgi:hypothetical protein